MIRYIPERMIVNLPPQIVKLTKKEKNKNLFYNNKNENRHHKFDFVDTNLIPA